MPPTMKALVKLRPEPGLWLEEAPLPQPGPNEILFRVHKTAICGTDLHIYQWDEWAQKTTRTPRPESGVSGGVDRATSANTGGTRPANADSLNIGGPFRGRREQE